MQRRPLDLGALHVTRDKIVELAAYQALEQAYLPGASFAEVIYVSDEILQTESSKAVARVHGIGSDEIA